MIKSYHWLILIAFLGLGLFGTCAGLAFDQGDSETRDVRMAGCLLSMWAGAAFLWGLGVIAEYRLRRKGE